jgi:hypothetical protein
MLEQTLDTLIARCGMGLKASGTLLMTRPTPLECFEVGVHQLASLVETFRVCYPSLHPALRQRFPQTPSTTPFGLAATDELLRDLERALRRLVPVVQTWAEKQEDTYGRV